MYFISSLFTSYHLLSTYFRHLECNSVCILRYNSFLFIATFIYFTFVSWIRLAVIINPCWVYDCRPTRRSSSIHHRLWDLKYPALLHVDARKRFQTNNNSNNNYSHNNSNCNNSNCKNKSWTPQMRSPRCSPYQV